MFRESLLESAGGVKTNQRWTALLSLGLEGLVIALLLVVPLMQEQGLPQLLWVSAAAAPLSPPPRGLPHAGPRGRAGRSPRAISPVLMPPNFTPSSIDLTAGGARSSATDTGPSWPLGVPDGVERSTGPWLNPPVASPRPPVPPASRRPSIVTEGNVISRVLPVYPPIARQIGAQGPVVLQAVISREGMVENLRIVSSAHPLLNQAALEAVSQWRFRPYLLNGVPVEVEAQITVNFTMSR